MSSAHPRSVEQLLRDLTPQVLGALNTTPSRFRRSGGRNSGGAARRINAVATRGCAGQPGGLALQKSHCGA